MAVVQKNIRFSDQMQIIADTLMASTGDNLTKVVHDALKLYAKQVLTEDEGAEMLIKMYDYIS